MATLENKKYNIICLSNQLWDFPLWTNKRHVMFRLAKWGNNVLYIDPPINTGFVFLRQLSRGHWNLLRLITQTKKDPSGSIIYTPLNLVPFARITSQFHIKRINKLAKKYFDPALPTVLWVYHVQLPYLKDYIDQIKYDKLIYDCVDNYAGFPENSAFYSTVVPKSQVIAQEKLLAQKADVVFATAPGLVDKLKAFNENVHFTPNVGDYARFKNAQSLKNNLPEDLERIPTPRIGYIGAIDDYKFDVELLKKVARDHPDYSFVIIGPLGLKDKEGRLEGFEELRNVHFLGSRPYEQKVYYLAGFDVDMIPYQINDYTVGGCFPVKFHDSLATGLPVVVTDLPAYLPFADVCYISKTYDEFSANISKALNENSVEKVRARQEIAKQNDWDGKVERMLELIERS